jgi:hypothetical protein
MRELEAVEREGKVMGAGGISFLFEEGAVS